MATDRVSTGVVVDGGYAVVLMSLSFLLMMSLVLLLLSLLLLPAVAAKPEAIQRSIMIIQQPESSR